MRWVRTLRFTLTLLAGFVPTADCAGTGVPRGDSTHRPVASLVKPGIELGEFLLPRGAVVDGDTVRVAGVPKAIRCLFLDTEEDFPEEVDRAPCLEDWSAWLEAKQPAHSRPAKFPSPIGKAATDFARDFFRGVRQVTLERDEEEDARDVDGRFLAYIFVRRGSHSVLYNLECVRAGLSPYYTKYGRSKRFDEAFVRAEQEAREAGRGIWAADAQGYPDYDILLAWWRSRAAFIDRFEAECGADGRRLCLELSRDWLEERCGTDVDVLGSMQNVEYLQGSPARVWVGLSGGDRMLLLFLNHSVFLRTGLDRGCGELVRVRGVPSEHHSERTGKRELRIPVHYPEQVELVANPWAEPGPPDTRAGCEAAFESGQIPVLEEVRLRINAAKDRPVVVFDIDETLLDTRPRTLAILRDLGREVAEVRPDLSQTIARLTAKDVRYLVTDTLVDAGVRDLVFIDLARTRWEEAFFGSQYLGKDASIPGAAAYVTDLCSSGARVVYLSGRNRAQMLTRTRQRLESLGFPVADDSVLFLLKPLTEMSDRKWKMGAFERIARLGELVAAFENEPDSLAEFASRWPEVRLVLLETQRSPMSDAAAPAGTLHLKDYLER